MKKGLLAIAIAIMMGFASSDLLAQGGPGYGGYGPGYGMGPGMMGGYGGYGGGYGPGWGMGPGMMWGYGNGPGYGPGYNQQYQQPYGRAVNKAEAREIMNNYLSSLRNPNLKLGNIKDESNAFEADVLTRKGNDLVNKIFVDKQTGRVSFAY